jgi:hypothetical protein
VLTFGVDGGAAFGAGFGVKVGAGGAAVGVGDGGEEGGVVGAGGAVGAGELTGVVGGGGAGSGVVAAFGVVSLALGLAARSSDWPVELSGD